MTGTATERAADFVRRFEEYWKAPTPDGLDALLTHDVVLVAPTLPETRNLEDGKRVWGQLLTLIPDLRTDVHRWGATEDGVLIEFTLSGTVNGTPISWGAVDRFVVGDDGLATERIAYFDPSPLIAALTPATDPS